MITISTISVQNKRSPLYSSISNYNSLQEYINDVIDLCAHHLDNRTQITQELIREFVIINTRYLELINHLYPNSQDFINCYEYTQQITGNKIIIPFLEHDSIDNATNSIPLQLVRIDKCSLLIDPRNCDMDSILKQICGQSLEHIEIKCFVMENDNG